jgi:HEAT repeat protein
MRRRWIGSVLTLLVSALAQGQAVESAPMSNIESALGEVGQALSDLNRPLAERQEMLKALEGWTTPAARDHLLAALKDPAPEIRAGAAAALGWPGNRDAVTVLRARFEATDEPASVRTAALGALGRIGDPSTRPLMLGMAQSPETGFREAALWSLTFGPLVDPADRTAQLMRLAEDRPLDAQLRCDAIRALAAVREDRVIDLLMRLLEQEPRRKIALPPGQPTQQQVMALRFVQARDVAAWAAGALGQLEGKQALPLLLKTAEEPEDFFLRLMSMQALIHWSAPEAVPVLMRRSTDPLPDNRVVALIGLMKLGDKTAVPSVLARLSDDNSSVRAQAVTTLAALGGPSVRPPLEELQRREPSQDVLSALDEALSRLPR